MAYSVNDLENLAAVRLLEFVSNHSPWNRSLWGIGVILALDELFEAVAMQPEGHLSPASINQTMTSIRKRVGNHPVFTGAEKGMVNQHLKEVPAAFTVGHYSIRQMAERVRNDYLTRWGRHVATGNFSVELFARSVAGHLLDAGFSGQYLRDFINQRIKAPAPFSLANLCGELHQQMTAAPPRDFEVILAFRSLPRLLNGIPTSWLRPADAVNWLRRRGFDTAGIRVAAALILTVRARDIHGAVQLARSESDRYASRTLLATGQPLQRYPKLWIAGATAPFDLDHDRRGVEVKELYRENRIFSPDANKSLDAALDLLAHLDGSSPGAAVAGGWGAIEGLLAPPGNRSSAADNLAGLVTCSFPRAELTRLAHLVQEEQPGVYPALEAAQTNRERSRIVGDMIIQGTMPKLSRWNDQAAVTRMAKLFQHPKTGLSIIREVISDSFHRLYRQRNLILHGGRLDSVALTAGLRTVAKLAGAGMDRVTHGQYVQNIEPLDLVAKADIALNLVDSADSLACVDLLETH
jgi:hypothetical protein